MFAGFATKLLMPDMTLTPCVCACHIWQMALAFGLLDMAMNYTALTTRAANLDNFYGLTTYQVYLT